MALANPYSPGSQHHGHQDPPRPVSGQFSSPEDSDAEEEERYTVPGYAEHGDSRLSLRDEEDYAYGGGKRVLKVRSC